MAGAKIHLHAWLCRYCSEAFHLCPHRGRYPQGGRQRSTTPDMLSMQALLAGMADRGAQAAIIEASEEGLHCGRSVRNPLGSGGVWVGGLAASVVYFCNEFGLCGLSLRPLQQAHGVEGQPRLDSPDAIPQVPLP